MSNDNRFDPPQPFNPHAQQPTPGPQMHQDPAQAYQMYQQGQPGQPGQPGGFVPPQPTEPKKNWFARHKFLTVVGAIIAIAIVGSALGGGGTPADKPVASPSASPNVTQDGTDATNPEAEPTVEEVTEEAPAEPDGLRIGDAAVAGDMVYTVTKVENKSVVGPSFSETKAKGMFVVVTLDVTNNSNESAMVDSSFFTLKSGDKKFDADSSASLWANTGEDGANTSFFLEKLNPDLTMSGTIVFDVSEQVATATDNVLIAATGFFGLESVEILLAD